MQHEVPDGARLADETVADRESQRVVQMALGRLNLEQRAVFVMHEIDGCSAPEIADTIGIPLNTVYSRLRLARGKFVKAVRRIHPDGGGR